MTFVSLRMKRRYLTKGESHAHPFSLTAVALCAAALIPTAAVAEPKCGPRDTVIGHLAKKYGEAPAAMGVTSNGALVEVLENKTKDTWTIVVTLSDLTTCLIAAGEGWRSKEYAEPVGPGA